MRVLMWFVIGFAGACGAAAYALSPTGMILLSIASLLASVAFFALRKWKVCAIVLLGCALGFGWYTGYDALYLKPIRSLDGTVQTLQVEASDFSYQNDYGTVVDGHIQLDGKRYQIRAYTGEDQELIPGRTVTGQFRLRYTALGGREDPTHHRGDGTLLLAYPVSAMEYHARETMQLRHVPAYLRQHVLDTIRDIFPGDTAAFACALLLGDCSGIDYETDTAFKISGIRHVIAVSGLHVSILFSVIYILMGRRRIWDVLLGIPALVLFAAMAGFTPSVNRACLMQGIMILSTLVPRDYDAPTSLAFAGFVMLLGNPQSITSVGFQLSTASVAGIFLFHEQLAEWMRKPFGKRKGTWARIIGAVTSSVAISLSAMVLTVPLSAVYFGTVSLISVITNFLTLWIINFLFCGIILACLAAWIYAPGAYFMAMVLAWPIRFVMETAKLLSSVPLSAVYTQSAYTVLWLVCAYVLLTVFMLGKERRPMVLAACLSLTLAVSVAASWLEPKLAFWRMTVLDAGQGQCIVLQSEGKTYMVDCGGSSGKAVADLAAATLLSQGITHLDGLILTHYDRDHVGGTAYLLTRIHADKVYLPYMQDAELSAPELAELQGEHVREDIQLLLKSAQITILAPRQGKTDNETSLCVLFQAGNCDILITGDRDAEGEMELLLEQKLPDLEILVAGHHGADTATSEFLLRATQPETVIISVDENNRYNHPSAALLWRLQAHGCVVRRTDLEGTIILKG